MATELKPCPFCGGKPVLVKRMIKKPAFCCDGVEVRCGRCGARGPLHLGIKLSSEEITYGAIKSWNKRPGTEEKNTK